MFWKSLKERREEMITNFIYNFFLCAKLMDRIPGVVVYDYRLSCIGSRDRRTMAGGQSGQS
jgi:hypothetical protein